MTSPPVPGTVPSNRMVQVGNIKLAEAPRYEDYVAVSVVQEALRGLARVSEVD